MLVMGTVTMKPIIKIATMMVGTVVDLLLILNIAQNANALV